MSAAKAPALEDREAADAVVEFAAALVAGINAVADTLLMFLEPTTEEEAEATERARRRVMLRSIRIDQD